MQKGNVSVKQTMEELLQGKVSRQRLTNRLCSAKTLEDTLANALSQIEEKQYEATLISEGFAPEQIPKYGFAFQGKTCLIGSAPTAALES